MDRDLDDASSAITTYDLRKTDVDDVLDNFGEYVPESGRDVITVSTDGMPTRTGAAANHRF